MEENIEMKGESSEIGTKAPEKKKSNIDYKKCINSAFGFFKENKIAGYGVIVAVILLVVIIVIVSLPGNRAVRMLKKADKLFANEQYEEALEKYTKASLLKESLTRAYTGKILADMALNNGNAKEDMLFADEKVLEYGGFEDEEGVNDLIDLYLLAPENLSENPDELIRVLLNGFNYTNEANELLPAIGDAYILMADSLVSTDSKEALSYYDNAYSLRPDDENLISKMKSFLENYVVALTLSDSFDEAFSIVNGYANILSSDVSDLTDYVSTAKGLYDTKISLLSQAYDAMKFYYDLVGKDFSQDMITSSEGTLIGMMSCGWADMLQLDGSEPANMLASSQSQKCYVYCPEGFNEKYSGFAVGLYPYGDVYTDENGEEEVSYYFYFGEYKDGIRNGYGFTIIKSGLSSYLGFEGNWENDAPNGFGAYYQSDMYAYTSLAEYQRVTFGNFTDGLQNGNMTTRIRLSEFPDEVFEGSYVATNGDAQAIPSATEDYEILEEGRDGYKLIAVAPSVNSGYDFYIPIYKNSERTLSTIGY